MIFFFFLSLCFQEPVMQILIFGAMQCRHVKAHGRNQQRAVYNFVKTSQHPALVLFQRAHKPDATSICLLGGGLQINKMPWWFLGGGAWSAVMDVPRFCMETILGNNHMCC